MPNLVLELLARPIPEKLWHYTSITGFQGIVESKRIWATDARFLNDREELIHIDQFADEVIEAATERDKELVSLALRLARIRGLRVFVACFTELEDNLSQWRGYSHDSIGVSLAFDFRLVRPPAAAESVVAFAPCIYSDERKGVLVNEALRHFIDAVRNFYPEIYEVACQEDPTKRNRKDKRNVVKEFLDANPHETQRLVLPVVRARIFYLQVAALSKNSSFQGEREWRLVLPMFEEPDRPLDNPPQFRAGKTTLIPFIAHPTNGPTHGFPLVDVILGPGSDEDSVSAARRFLKLKELNIEPRVSKVPYRQL
jgi:hypothetical protein